MIIGLIIAVFAICGTLLYARRLRRERDFWWRSYLHATRACWGPLARPHCEVDPDA